MTYEGPERRKMSSEDHDLLTRIDTNLSSFMNRFDAHEKKDEERFKFLERFAYGLGGVFIFVEVVAKFIK